MLGELAVRLPRLAAAHAGGRTVLALGLATGHRVDPVAGVIVEHPQLGWRDVPARDILAAATGLPVHVDSHSRALARAEQLFGEESTRTSTVLLFVGAVVDAAFATEGAMHRGPRSGAGSVAHLPLGTAEAGGDADGAGGGGRCSCGRTDCLQSEVSERAMVRRAAGQGQAVDSFPELLDLALAGEPRAVALFRRRARLVGRAAALLLDMFDPEVLVVVEPGWAGCPSVWPISGTRWRSAPGSARTRSGPWCRPASPARCWPRPHGAVALGALYTDPLGPWPALPAVS